RRALILDIFAQRAKTREGRLQVELAQSPYLLPRLTGMWTHLERQEGAIGTRGPGETQLETDRRLVRQRISRLEDELDEVRRVRAVQRERRIKNAVPVVAIVGYTNAGKSTLLNRVSGAGIPANDRLFDTLDTTTRRVAVSDTREILLSDTVGFIAKLPHHLVEAFQATLEELKFADLLLHVVDAADPDRDEHIQVVDRLIAQLAAPETPVLRCWNKADLAGPDELPREPDSIPISARTGENLPALLSEIDRRLDLGRHRVRLRLPYSMGGLVDRLHTQAQVLRVDYGPEGIEAEAVCDGVLYGQLRQYEVEA
ncbi:MAG: GTPase HflX, partial [Oscillospiraceae bacterium]|nr:GTPase HflX [Oscillospiraceae bacterium]